jgi:hypothetical protein
MNKVKRNTYVVVCDKQFENGLEDVELVIKTKNLGSKIIQPLMRQVSCIQGIASQIDECYGMSYEEILPLLKEFFGYEIIDKNDVIEPYKCGILDTFYNWELYAQNSDYGKECDVLEVEGLREKLREMIEKESRE